MEYRDFLFELGTEELPAKGLDKFAENLGNLIIQGLAKVQLKHGLYQIFATPRRLAIFIKKLHHLQPSRLIERKGPAVAAAFDSNGNPTKACEGFAKSCGVSVSELQRQETPQGTWLVHRYEETGKTVQQILPEIITHALASLPIPKPMRWNSFDFAFSRPAHWVVMLYGDEIIPATILGLTASNITYGHRFLCKKPLTLKQANQYEKALLHKGYVIANFAKRKALIQEQAMQKAHEQHGTAIIAGELLDEVTGLVEWPVALAAAFNKDFLAVPKEALISSMQNHQKCFPIENQQGELLPFFITISNIASIDPSQVIAGNERVMRARLSDAAFFFHTDQKIPLAERVEKLQSVIFQAKLGNLYDKSLRIAQLAKTIAQAIPTDSVNINIEWSYRAGKLCKADLLTAMVGEFPELQGLMGYYYHPQQTTADQEIAIAIRDHYRPRFTKDELPSNLTACTVALADRLDTLVGIFGIGQAPTGEKDPFGLRRAAIGVLRILIEKKLPLDLDQLLTHAQANYGTLSNQDIVTAVRQFILERLKAWYQEQGIAPDTLQAVLVAPRTNNNLLDIHLRVQAVQIFRQLPEATALAAANKRVSNILTKIDQTAVLAQTDQLATIQQHLLENEPEHNLYQAIQQLWQQSSQPNSVMQINYTERLTRLAQLRKPIDLFFDKVMVMANDKQLRNNRLALLASLRHLFLQVADISLLQS